MAEVAVPGKRVHRVKAVGEYQGIEALGLAVHELGYRRPAPSGRLYEPFQDVAVTIDRHLTGG